VAIFPLRLNRLPQTGEHTDKISGDMTDTQPNKRARDGATARRIVRVSALAALATLDADTGAPYASLVSVATAMDGAPLALMSRLAQHWRNIEADPRVSLMFDASEGHEDPLAGARVSVMGRASITGNPAEERRFRARHPAAFYADFKDFSCFRIEPDRAHLVAGFGRVHWIERADLLLPPGATAALEADEPDILAHMNRDHADAVHLIATMLLGVEPGAWEMTGIDPEGIDISIPARHLRVDFAAPVSDSAGARRAVAELTREARARGDA
jgi:hypothetical protein